ncbi:dystroglycan-like [Dorcoceras hygrometricum]|uniref:Dystroglycan-like n=1 Tax=Dorcoceras hygrometricum TaxID=472368 RepID=A0A2Z7A8F3_9LAMI|nr:dystroglycan-like [Dorcoceras hygrometricum]
MYDPGMVSMFQALMASGIEDFLGCPAVIYEAALVDFFKNASVRDGVIISTVAGQLVEISEEWFAESFDLPVDGLSELSEIPKDVVFDARSIVSMSGEPVSLSGKKSQMKIEYRLLCDIMAKSISVKAGSFNAITVENFSMLTAVVCGVRMNWASVLFNILKKMVTPGSKQAKGFAVQISLLLENIPNLDLGESSEFPASKILMEKTVHRYVSLNDKVGAEEAAGTPKPKAASKKRPAAVLGDERVEAVPIQIVEPTTAAPAAEDIFAQPVAEDEIPADPPADEVAGELLMKKQLMKVLMRKQLMMMLQGFVGSIALERTVLRSVQIPTLSADSQHVQLPSSLVFDSPIVQIEQSAAFAYTDEQMDIDLSDDSSLHFDDNDAAAASISLPAAPIPDVTKALAQLRASIEQISERDDGAKHKDTLLLHLHDLERNITARFDAQDRVLGALRKDSNDQRILMSLDLKSSHKQLSTQIASNALDVVDVRRVVREHHQELNAKINSLDEQVAATRHDFLEFSAQAQQTLNIITDQLSKLVAYINHGGNDKKGVISRSRPPPDDQNRGSGNTGGGGDTVRTMDIPQRDIDNAQRNILERLMSADRAREEKRRSKSRSGSGSYKRRR